MTFRRFAIVLSLLAASAVAARGAQESVDKHTGHPQKVVVLDNEHLQPSKLELSGTDALVFENHSVHAMLVRFTDPEDIAKRVHCGFVRRDAKATSEAPWQLFSWSNGQLVAVIPPGRHASVCSMAPGSYAYVVTRQGAEARGEAGTGLLPEKGQIVVK
jgi:hypothetical protein